MPKNYARLPWTKNFRKIPHAIESRLEGMAGTGIIVACSKIITGEELERGTYEHVSRHCAATKLMTEKGVSEQTWHLAACPLA